MERFREGFYLKYAYTNPSANAYSSNLFAFTLHYFNEDYTPAGGGYSGENVLMNQGSYTGSIQATRWRFNPQNNANAVAFGGDYLWAYRYNHRNELESSSLYRSEWGSLNVLVSKPTVCIPVKT